MPNRSDMDAAMANVGYNVFEGVGRAVGMFAFGIDPVQLGYAIGGLIYGTGSSSPWKHRDIGQETHQN
jgi:hypothetical protein